MNAKSLAAFATLVPAVLLAFSAAARAQDPKINDLAIKAREVLVKHCAECHGDIARPKAKLNVLDHEKLLKSVVVAGEPEKSELISRISLKDDDDLRMPPLNKTGLSELEIRLLRDWVTAGAPAPKIIPKTPEPKTPDEPKTKPEVKPEIKPEVKPEIKPEVKPEIKPEVKTPEVVKVPVFQQEQNPATPSAQLTAKVKDIFRNRCYTCHSGPSPKGRLDIFNAASMHQRKLVKGNKEEVDASELLVRLRSTDPSEVMPPKGVPLTSDEISLVRQWILDGAKDFEVDIEKDAKFLGREYVYEQILKDVRKLGVQASQHRYFSFNHLIAAGITKDDLKAHEQALALAINHLTWASGLERPVAIDEPVNSIFRVNINRLGWLNRPFKDVTNDKNSNFTLFDLVLLEYPYGVIASGNLTYGDLTKEFLVPAAQVRPIVYVRGDWFICMALQAPLYEDLLQLPRDIQTLERLLSVDSARNLANVSEKRVRRAGMTVSGVSRNNRIVERHEPTKNFRHYWKSLDFATSAGVSNILARPNTTKPDGGEMIWSLPNGLQAYFVTDGAGNRITEAPTSIVVDGHASDKIVRNGIGCIRCHGNGIQKFEDDVRPSVEALQTNTPDFDRSEILDLYPTKTEMDQIIAQDKLLFQNAVIQLLGKSVNVTDVMERVTKRYLDDAITGFAATAELGVPDPQNWKNVFRVGGNAFLGISHLAADGHIRRDAWDATHDRVIDNMNMGVPIVITDGLRLRSFEPKDKINVDMKINRKALDQAELVIKNTGKTDLFIEVVLFANNGKVVRLSSGVEELKVGGADFRFPKDATKFIPVTPDALVDHITLYASDKAFSPGVVLRLNGNSGENIADRFVHPVYDVRVEGGRMEVTGDPRGILKKTIESVTR